MSSISQSKVYILFFSSLALLFISSQAYTTDPLFDPVGQWRAYHKDGTTFEVFILSDGTASSTADHQKGTWQWDNGSVVIDFTDGWRDVIEKDPSGSIVKKSWAPGMDRSKPSQNISGIERIIATPNHSTSREESTTNPSKE